MINENNLGWVILIVAVDYVLKAIALWIAARKGSKIWFILLLILNTVGILPLFYIFYFSKQDLNHDKNSRD